MKWPTPSRSSWLNGPSRCAALYTSDWAGTPAHQRGAFCVNCWDGVPGSSLVPA